MDNPSHIIRKGSVSDIPKFDPVAELLKAGRYAKFGHAENTSNNGKYQLTQNDNLNKVLAVLNKEMTSMQIALEVGCSQSGAYKWLAKLGEMGKVDRRSAKVNGLNQVLFWRINN